MSSLNQIAALFDFWPTLSQRLAVRAFYSSGGEALRYQHGPAQSGLAIDLGGYEGEFVRECRARFGCRVWTFEPVKGFAQKLGRQFAQDENVRVFDFGLAGEASRPLMLIDGPATRAAEAGQGGEVLVELKAVLPFLEEQNVEAIGLLKINIEGGEFELLEALLGSPWMAKIDRLQIQFHPHVPRARARRAAIRAALRQTHELEWNFPWIWESWRLKGALSND